MAVFLELIAVGIPLAVEVLGNEPVAVKELLGSADSESVKQENLKLIVSESVFVAAADIVEASPELLGEIHGADVGHKSAGILDGSPLKHAVKRNVIHDGIHVLDDVGIKNAGLTERYPIFKT